MEQLSRRNFLALSGASVAAAGAAATLAEGSISAAQAEELSIPEIMDDQTELPIPEGEKPEATEYEADVVVVGCGMAGLNAATAAKNGGASVLVVEKGTPGYGGMTPFAGGTSKVRDDADWPTTLKSINQSNEYIVNQTWLKVWFDEANDFADRITDWGLLAEYTDPVDTPYWVDGIFDGQPGHDDERGYFQSEEVATANRHQRYVEVLDNNGIPYLDHTMLCDVLEDDGRVVGAIALHVPSGEIIQIKAKAVILCAGAGTIRQAGMPVGGGTFDAPYIGYLHGLPIGGGEFEDYHMAFSGCPGSVLTTSGWDYCESFGCHRAGKTADASEESLWSDTYLQSVNFPTAIDGLPTPDLLRYGGKKTPMTSWDAPGAAIGMSLHMTGGIFCGWEDDKGATALPGLYAAGDGSLASYIGGAVYNGVDGLTTSSCGVQGNCAGRAAAAYVSDLDFVDLPSDQVETISSDILAPFEREKGFTPLWVEEQLMHAMGTQPVILRKNEDILNAALVQVEFIRDNYLPKLKANSTHDLRLCREAIAKTTISEIKLRAGLAHKESRGFHYRSDYPYRDDQYLGVFTATKTDNGMEISFNEIPDEWKGDLSASYEERYGNCFRFAGEAEAKGLEE